MRSILFLCSLALLVACRRVPAAEPPSPTTTPAAPAEARAPVPPAIARILPEGAGAPSSASARNIERLPQLGAQQRKLLDAHGFFVAPQPTLPPASAAEARTAQRAKHLFQIYERNDYIRFPSYVTVDLAIDLTHQYFDVVLKTLEREHLAPKLRTALLGMTRTAQAMHTAARTQPGKRAAMEAAIYWGTALRLLEEPAPGDRPDAVEVHAPWADEADAPERPPSAPPPRAKVTRWRGELERTVAARAGEIRAAAGKGVYPAWGLELDLTQTRPRSHYTETGVLQRYFRAMSFLGLSSFAAAGDRARPPVLALLVRSYAGSKEAKALDEALSIADFVVGEPPTTGLRAAAELAGAALPGFASASADVLVADASTGALGRAWAKLPEHPIERDGPVIQPAGQRVFADTLALSALLPVVRELDDDREGLVKRSMGALGAAAMLGSDPARDVVLADAGDRAAAIGEGITRGRELLGELGRRDDAYHRTLVALRSMLGADALWFDARAWELRMLQSFAGGWAMLRHDTLLYAYEMGAECDAEDLPAPYGWVEPVPETYAALRTMVEAFAARVAQAGIVEPAPPEDGDDYGYTPFRTVAQKTRAITALLDRLEGWSKAELAGEVFDADDRTEIAMVGGLAEHVLLTLADAYELGAGNDDMAIVADVLTWKQRALEVGVAQPELIYALVPSPEGWVIARGAVLGYRELLVPANDRLTDEAWRKRLAAKDDLAWGIGRRGCRRSPRRASVWSSSRRGWRRSRGASTTADRSRCER